MRKRFSAFALLFFTFLVLTAQENPLLTGFLKNFDRAQEKSIKLQLLQSSESYELAGIGELYVKALGYVLTYSGELDADADLINIALLSLKMIGVRDYGEGLSTVWDVFLESEQSSVKLEALHTLGLLSSAPEAAAKRVGGWLDEQYVRAKYGELPDEQLVREAVLTLQRLKVPESFFVLFRQYSLGYSQNVLRLIRGILYSLDVPLEESFLRIIDQEDVPLKILALNEAFAVDTGLGIASQGRIAEFCLETGLSSQVASQEVMAGIRDLRYRAAARMIPLQYSEAAGTVIRHLNRSIIEFERGLTARNGLLEAIACVGSLGTHEAAERLSQYLLLLNSYVDNGQGVDDQVVLAVIANLGMLGNPVAFESLQYSTLLDYSANIRKAAREALDQLNKSGEF